MFVIFINIFKIEQEIRTLNILRRRTRSRLTAHGRFDLCPKWNGERPSLKLVHSGRRDASTMVTLLLNGPLLIFINVVFTSVSSFVTWIIKLPSPSNHIQCRDVACGHKISIELSVSISICVSFPNAFSM